MVFIQELEREEYTPRKPERAVPPQFIRNHGSPDVTMESSLLHTETMESPVPDRRKKKKITTTTDTHMQSFVPDADRHIERGPPGRHDAPAWLQLQHEKLMSRRYKSVLSHDHFEGSGFCKRRIGKVCVLRIPNCDFMWKM